MSGPANMEQSLITSLSGIEKVAVLLLALGKSRASGILRRFDQDELKALTRSAANLRPLSARDVKTLVEEFAQKFSNGVKFMGTEGELRHLLSDVMSDDDYTAALYGTDEPMVAPMMQALQNAPRDEQMWDKLSKLKVEQLRAYLLEEHPQTCALILSKLDSEMAAKVISSFPTDARSLILVRMLAVKDVNDEAMQVIESALAEDLLAVEGPTKHGGVADILNRLEKQQTEDVLRSISEIRPDDAKALKNMLFSFDDMITLTAAARTLVLDQVPIEKLVLALRGTDGTFQTTLLASLAARSRRMVEAELASGTVPPPREIQEARRFVVDTVLRMNSRGDIQIRPPDDLGDVTA